jgi:hypothetical protein
MASRTANPPAYRAPGREDDPTKIAAYLNRTWNTYRTQRRPWLRQVEENVRNLAGRQYDTYIDSLGEFVNLSEVFVPSDERWRRAPVFNWLGQVWFMQSLAKLTENVPLLGALPASADRKDAQLAAIWDSFWRYQWRQMSMAQKAYAHYGWLLTTGESVLYLEWDPTRGQASTYEIETGQPEDALEPAEPQPAGDFNVTVVCPTSVLWPYGPEPYYEKPWVMRERLMHVEEIAERFDVNVEPESFQSPPRSPRAEPALPVRSFHSVTFPLWSNVP